MKFQNWYVETEQGRQMNFDGLSEAVIKTVGWGHIAQQGTTETLCGMQTEQVLGAEAARGQVNVAKCSLRKNAGARKLIDICPKCAAEFRSMYPRLSA